MSATETPAASLLLLVVVVLPLLVEVLLLLLLAALAMTPRTETPAAIVSRIGGARLLEHSK